MSTPNVFIFSLNDIVKTTINAIKLVLKPRESALTFEEWNVAELHEQVTM